MSVLKNKIAERMQVMRDPPRPLGMKPCPFCGSLPKWWGVMTEKNNYHLSCSCPPHPEVHGKSAEECITQWNVRSPGDVR